MQVLDRALDLRVVAPEADVTGDVEDLLADVEDDADGMVVARADVPGDQYLRPGCAEGTSGYASTMAVGLAGDEVRAGLATERPLHVLGVGDDRAAAAPLEEADHGLDLRSHAALEEV